MYRGITLPAALLCALLAGCAAAPTAPSARSAAAGAGETYADPLEALAARGDADAQFRLGNAYERGAGRPLNSAEAFAWYSRAAAQGHAAAQFFLGAMHASSRAPQGLNVEEAVRWYGLAAAQSYTDAFFPMAYASEFGIGIARNPAQAVAWYERSAEAGVWQAMDRLAKAYQRGELGLDADRERAQYWQERVRSALGREKPLEVPLTR